MTSDVFLNWSELIYFCHFRLDSRVCIGCVRLLLDVCLAHFRHFPCSYLLLHPCCISDFRSGLSQFRLQSYLCTSCFRRFRLQCGCCFSMPGSAASLPSSFLCSCCYDFWNWFRLLMHAIPPFRPPVRLLANISASFPFRSQVFSLLGHTPIMTPMNTLFASNTAFGGSFY